MTGQLPFDPLTPAALARLTEGEQATFTSAVQYVQDCRVAPYTVLVGLAGMVHRLVTEEACAGAKLAAITAYCQAKADDFNSSMPMRVRPQDMKISAGDILAIISGGAGSG